MRNLRRNCTKIYFRLYAGKEPIMDEYGNETGEFKILYSDLKTCEISLSPNKGTSEIEMFGSLEDYDRTMITHDMTCPIDENSILWLDNADTTGPHTHTVLMRAPSMNAIAFAIKKVKISQDENQG